MAGSLSSLKVKALKHIAFLTGCNAASNKNDLVDRLRSHLHRPLVMPKNGRILSVDMGIRNLAYCVLESGELAQIDREVPANTSVARSLQLRIKAWQRLDLMKQLQSVQSNNVEDDEDKVPMLPPETGIFSPANVSKLAFGVTRRLLEHQPDVVLIEQQRFRSGGGSAIQEWTVRVNMLESMLWACFETLKQTSTTADHRAPLVYSVSPARVAKFWVAGRSMSLSADSGTLSNDKAISPDTEGDTKSKITKQDKIAVLESLLEHRDNSAVSLTFTDDVSVTAARFMRPKGKRHNADQDSHPKLDDLADCLLQGAAWQKWEDNRQQLQSHCH